jgi:hypothetical protein
MAVKSWPNYRESAVWSSLQKTGKWHEFLTFKTDADRTGEIILSNRR